MTALKSNLQLGASIGSGFFGEVFLAQDDVHGQVAVKVLMQTPGESSADWQERKKGLLEEAQRLSQAEHTNVVRVYHLLESDTSDAIHLVMEYYPEGSLQKDFEAGPMRLDKALKAAMEVAFGLQALHARGMLHRDVKPGNLLRDLRGVIRLGDFGLVTDDLVLGYGSQAGYSDHIAHEVWNGSGTTARSDIWALGMTIYRLVHGAAWYRRSSPPRSIVMHGGFAKSLRWLPHIPKRWRRVIRQMLHDDPHERYQSAGQVISALATLSAEPDWVCSVRRSQITWRRRAKGRRIKVLWKMHSPRRYEWAAWSEPIGSGKKRSMGGSVGRVSYAQSERDLIDFFAKHS